MSGYIRLEQKSGLIGIYEKTNPNSVWEDHCPWDAENELFAADYDRVMPWLENALERMPVFAKFGIKKDVHGAISHPPDGNPLIGPAPGVNNYWCCCGYVGQEVSAVRTGVGVMDVTAFTKVEVTGAGAETWLDYGHTVNKGLAFAYIKPAAAVVGSSLSIMIMGEPRAALVLGESAYDPENLLPRAT